MSDDRAEEQRIDFTIPVSPAGTAVPFSATKLLVKKLGFMAKQATGANTGNITYGGSTVKYGVTDGLVFEKGEYYEEPLEPGELADLATRFIDAATNGDGIVGFYCPA